MEYVANQTKRVRESHFRLDVFGVYHRFDDGRSYAVSDEKTGKALRFRTNREAMAEAKRLNVICAGSLRNILAKESSPHYFEAGIIAVDSRFAREPVVFTAGNGF